MSICDNQDNFNKAFKAAVDNMDNEQCTTNTCKTSVTIVYIILLILYVYAIILAMRADQEHRVMHLSLAFILGPIYVLAYYLARFQY
jgi:flagellar biogenesis protein FliO